MRLVGVDLERLLALAKFGGGRSVDRRRPLEPGEASGGIGRFGVRDPSEEEAT
jgi:hypothetical protein